MIIPGSIAVTISLDILALDLLDLETHNLVFPIIGGYRENEGPFSSHVRGFCNTISDKLGRGTLFSFFLLRSIEY